MRRVAILVGSLGLVARASMGCESIAGITDHKLAAQGHSGPDAGETGVDGSSSDAAESGSAGTTDSGPADNDGGAVAPVLCAGDSAACVSGGMFSVGRTPDRAGGGAAILPDGAAVTLTDDGFELGGATCDTATNTCVTGALTR